MVKMVPPPASPLKAQKAPNPVQAIKQARAKSNEALASRDAPGVARLMAPDCVVTVGSGETVSGRDDVYASLWAQFEASPDCLYVRTPKSIKVSTQGTLAFEDGVWTGSWSLDGDQTSCGGRYAAAWGLSGAHWLIKSEIFVTLYEK